jgi:hypothetical protein
VSTALEYTPPLYGGAATAGARVDAFEDAVFTTLRRPVIATGAASVAMVEDYPGGRWSWHLDTGADVLAAVRLEVGGDTSGPATVRVVDLLGAVRGGAQILDVAAPGPAVAWFLLARVEGHFMMAGDPSGVGRQLAEARTPLEAEGNPSTSPPDADSPPTGPWLQAFTQRSGVAQVNKRNLRAMAKLYQANGKATALRVASAIRTSIIADYYEAALPPWWAVADPRGRIVAEWEPLATRSWSLPDRISRELERAAKPASTARKDDALGHLGPSTDIAASHADGDGTPWASAVTVKAVDPWIERHHGPCSGCGKVTTLAAPNRKCETCWDRDNGIQHRQLIKAWPKDKDGPEPVYEPVRRQRRDGELAYAERSALADPTGDRVVGKVADPPWRTEEERQVVLMAFEGMSQADIGRHLGIRQQRVADLLRLMQGRL